MRKRKIILLLTKIVLLGSTHSLRTQDNPVTGQEGIITYCDAVTLNLELIPETLQSKTITYQPKDESKLFITNISHSQFMPNIVITRYTFYNSGDCQTNTTNTVIEKSIQCNIGNAQTFTLESSFENEKEVGILLKKVADIEHYFYVFRYKKENNERIIFPETINLKKQPDNSFNHPNHIFISKNGIMVLLNTEQKNITCKKPDDIYTSVLTENLENYDIDFLQPTQVYFSENSNINFVLTCYSTKNERCFFLYDDTLKVIQTGLLDTNRIYTHEEVLFNNEIIIFIGGNISDMDSECKYTYVQNPSKWITINKNTVPIIETIKTQGIFSQDEQNVLNHFFLTKNNHLFHTNNSIYSIYDLQKKEAIYSSKSDKIKNKIYSLCILPDEHSVIMQENGKLLLYALKQDRIDRVSRKKTTNIALKVMNLNATIYNRINWIGNLIKKYSGYESLINYFKQSK